MNMELSIITVNYNDKENILNQIESVKRGASGLEYEQIISDNGSCDGSIDEIKRLHPYIKIIENNENIGFGAANNRALPFAGGEFILFLNPDMRIFPDSLKKLIDWMRAHSKTGIASPKLVDREGNFNEKSKPRRFPTVFNQSMLLLKIPHIIPSVLNNYLYSDFDENKEQEVDSVRGSFMLMRRDIIQELGWAFDPRYFIWFEDVDICQEVRKMDYKIIYTPIISCIDLVGQTFKKQKSSKKQRWFTESMLKYFKKWEPWYKWIFIAAFRPVGIFLADMQSFYKNNKF